MVDLSTKLISFFTISRSKMIVATFAQPALGLFLASTTLADLNIFSLIFFIMYLLHIVFACKINCYFDYEIDKKYKIELAQAVDNLGKKTIRILLLIEGILIGGLIIVLIIYGYVIVGIISVLGFILSIIYSATPPRFKKRGFLSAFPIILGLFLLPVLGGWLMISTTLTVFIIIFMCGYALMNEGINLVNTAEDYDEDLSEDVRTWAHHFGMRKVLRIAFLFTLIGGIGCLIGILLKFIQLFALDWGFFAACGFFIISIFAIALTSKDLHNIGLESDLKRSAKTHAKKLPKWFAITRYPMLLATFFLII